ncbi:MAG: DUF3786 domain-containing protein [Candidatus Helarchaeota archaeon]
MQKAFNANNYITLKQFEGGWIWIKNITKSTNRAIPHLEKKTLEEIEKIAKLMNGKLMPWQIFDDTLWVLQICPLPDLLILYVFNYDEEFGSALKIFYHKSSLKIPTEDVYVWTEYFLDFLALFAKDGFDATDPKNARIELISLEELLKIVAPANKEKVRIDIIGQREIPLLAIDELTAHQIGHRLKVPVFSHKLRAITIQWALQFNLFQNLNIFIAAHGTKIESYYTKNVLEFPTRRILFFTWLYCNAIIREARSILGDAIPKLSKYL